MLTPQRTTWALIATLIGLPMALSAAATLRPAIPRPAPVTDRPGLAFDLFLVDLGFVEPSEEVVARFGFTNTCGKRVTITDYTPSCGCLRPSLKKREYDPGESGEFLLRVRTATESAGGHEYTLLVKFDDGQPRESLLTFRVTLPENSVQVRPRALIFYQLGRDATTQTLSVTDRREKTLTVQGARCESPFVTLTQKEPVQTEEGLVEQRFDVTVAAEIPSQSIRTVVTIFTDDPQFPELKVPLILSGNSKRTQHTVARPVSQQRQVPNR